MHDRIRPLSFSSVVATLSVCGLMIGPPAGGRADASSQAAWDVTGKLLGEPKNPEGTDFKKSKDVSGIACTSESGFPRVCLVVDDESQGVQIVIVREGELVVGDFIRLIYDNHADKLLELDAEGAAFADGAFYVVGSHGRPRHEVNKPEEEARNKAQAAASRHVFRLRFGDGIIDKQTGKLTGAVEITPSSALVGFLKARPKLGFDVPLEDGGLTIEGVAVLDGRFYAGLRGPVVDGFAAMLSVPVRTLFDGEPGQSIMHTMDLETDTSGQSRGIRDIVVHEGRLLVLAGPVNNPEDDKVRLGDYAIYSYKQEAIAGNADIKGTATKRVDIDSFGKKVKPEALLPLGTANGKLRVLILFDGPEEGAPRPIEFNLP